MPFTLAESYVLAMSSRRFSCLYLYWIT